MLPDIESLRCFDAAAERLNFRAAAEFVHLSPAAFGDRIRRLEDDFGVKLFERTTRRVTLTSAGERLLPQARRTLVEAAKCSAAATDEGAVPPYEMLVGTRFELGMSWLVPGLDTLRRLAPERTVHLYFGDSPDLLDRLRRGGIDCLVSSVRLTSSDVEYAPLHEERYELVATPKLIAKRPLTRAADALEHTLIDAHRDLPLFSYFLDGVPPRHVWAFGRTELLGAIGAIRLRVLDGAGVAVLPHYFIRADLERKRLVRLMPKVKLQRDVFRMVWRRGDPNAARYRRLAEELLELPIQ